MKRLAMVFACTAVLVGIAGAPKNLKFVLGAVLRAGPQVAGRRCREQDGSQGKQGLGLAATGTEGCLGCVGSAAAA